MLAIVLKEQLTTEGGRAWAGVKKHDDVRAAGRMAPCATDKNMPRRTDEKLSIKRDSAPARRDFTGTPPIFNSKQSYTVE